MPTLRSRTVKRALIVGTAAVLIGANALGVAPATAQTARPHWDNYQWNGGRDRADTPAFWLYDRTGNATISRIIQDVANGWNGARAENPELPYIAVYKDAPGACFVNQTPGYSLASACMMPYNGEGVKGVSARNADGSGHLVGAAFAVSDSLGVEESFTIVCHMFGHIVGLEDSEDPASCMSQPFESDVLKWYTAADASYITAVYGHEDPSATTTTTPSATTTTEASTTTTEAPTTTTEPPSTTTEPPSTTTTTEPESTTTTTEPLLPVITIPSTTLPV